MRGGERRDQNAHQHPFHEFAGCDFRVDAPSDCDAIERRGDQKREVRPIESVDELWS
jgi:hypothetical protein